MKAVWLGLFGVHVFLFVLVVSAFAAGEASIYLPLMVMFAAGLCLWKSRG